MIFVMCNDLLVPQGGSIAPRSSLSKFHTEKQYLFYIIIISVIFYSFIYLDCWLVFTLGLWPWKMSNLKQTWTFSFFFFSCRRSPLRKWSKTRSLCSNPERRNTRRPSTRSRWEGQVLLDVLNKGRRTVSWRQLSYLQLSLLQGHCHTSPACVSPSLSKS